MAGSGADPAALLAASFADARAGCVHQLSRALAHMAGSAHAKLLASGPAISCNVGGAGDGGGGGATAAVPPRARALAAMSSAPKPHRTKPKTHKFVGPIKRGREPGRVDPGADALASAPRGWVPVVYRCGVWSVECGAAAPPPNPPRD
jgi:hypothetical protein